LLLKNLILTVVHNLFGVSTFENCEYVFIPRLNQASFVFAVFCVVCFLGLC